MSVDCSTMGTPVEYDIALHTICFENDKDIVVRDCAGTEKFSCDISLHDLCMEVRQSITSWNIRLGKPADMPIASPSFSTVLGLNESNAQILFEKQSQNADYDLVGSHDLRYNCVAEAVPPPDNGYKRFSYKLSKCRIKLKVATSELTIDCACESDPCGSEGHSGFRTTIALKP